MTPAFPAVGFVYVVRRYVPQNLRLVAFGGAGILCVASFAATEVLPWLFDVAPALLPFALSNGVVAGAVYTALDGLAGGPERLLRLGQFNIPALSSTFRLPLPGMMIGVVTSVAAPFLLYDAAFVAMHSCEPLGEGGIGALFRANLVAEASLVTGAVAGGILQTVLRPVVLGVPGMPWTWLAAPALAASVALCAVVYSSAARHVDQDTWVDTGAHPLDVVQRVDARTGQLGGWSRGWSPGSEGGGGNAGGIWDDHAAVARSAELRTRIRNRWEEDNLATLPSRYEAWLYGISWGWLPAPVEEHTVLPPCDAELRRMERYLLPADTLAGVCLHGCSRGYGGRGRDDGERCRRAGERGGAVAASAAAASAAAAAAAAAAARNLRPTDCETGVSVAVPRRGPLHCNAALEAVLRNSSRVALPLASVDAAKTRELLERAAQATEALLLIRWHPQVAGAVFAQQEKEATTAAPTIREEASWLQDALLPSPSLPRPDAATPSARLARAEELLEDEIIRLMAKAFPQPRGARRGGRGGAVPPPEQFPLFAPAAQQSRPSTAATASETAGFEGQGRRAGVGAVAAVGVSVEEQLRNASWTPAPRALESWLQQEAQRRDDRWMRLATAAAGICGVAGIVAVGGLISCFAGSR